MNATTSWALSCVFAKMPRQKHLNKHLYLNKVSLWKLYKKWPHMSQVWQGPVTQLTYRF